MKIMRREEKVSLSMADILELINSGHIEFTTERPTEQRIQIVVFTAQISLRDFQMQLLKELETSEISAETEKHLTEKEKETIRKGKLQSLEHSKSEIDNKIENLKKGDKVTVK